MDRRFPGPVAHGGEWRPPITWKILQAKRGFLDRYMLLRKDLFQRGVCWGLWSLLGPSRYCEFYSIDHVMILGRVSKGAGGTREKQSCHCCGALSRAARFSPVAVEEAK